ncbi:MAG: TspO/MBR family protein [Ideonella sp.]|nr:TspO/MBR family protein [Ideonella sp.]
MNLWPSYWTLARRRASVWAAAATILVAGLGGLATDIGPWYLALQQPPWKPSDLWFGPAWTLIYTLTAVAGVLVWERLDRGRARRWWLAQLGVNGLLNIAWSLLFFRLKRPDWALLEVPLLWLSVLLLLGFAARQRPLAAWLLVPYLAWVGFAAALNAAVVRLN